MRYPLSYFSVTGRSLLCLLCGGALLASCNLTPDSVGPGPSSSELELKSITLSDVSQFLVILQEGSPQGVALEVEAPDGDIPISLDKNNPLRNGEGKLVKGEDGIAINLHFTSMVPVDPDFDLEYKVGYTLDSVMMDLQIRPADMSSTPHLTQNQCITDNAVLTVTKTFPSWQRRSIRYPVDATIDSLQEIKNDKGESIYTGQIHLYVYAGPDSMGGPGSHEDTFFYTLTANILIE